MTKSLCTFFKITLSLCFLLSQHTLQAKNFDWALLAADTGTHEVKRTQVDEKGNVYVAGIFLDTANFNPGSTPVIRTSNGIYDIFITKYTSTGQHLWTKTIGGNDWDAVNQIRIKNGDIYLTGNFSGAVDFDPGTGISLLQSNGREDFFILKLDTAGNFKWAKSIGGNRTDYSNGVDVASNGDVYLTGYFMNKVDFNPSLSVADTFYMTSTTNNVFDAFILKLNSSGNFIWAKSIAGTQTTLGQSIAVENNTQNIVITGRFTGTTDLDPGTLPGNTFYSTSKGSYDVYICKLNSSGNLIWAKSFGGSQEETVNALTQDRQNNIFLTGGYRSTVDFNPDTASTEVFNITANGTFNARDLYILKLNPDGKFEYAKSIGSDFYDEEGFGIVTDTLDNLYITGNFRGTDVDFNPNPGTFLLSTNMGQDPFILQLKLNGDFVWAGNIYGGATYNFGNAIATDGNRNVYVGGTFKNTADFNPGKDTVLLTSSGNENGYLLKLTCNSKSFHTMTACNSISVNGTSYTASGNYMQTLPNATGCDSLIHLAITINPSTSRTLIEKVCDSFSLDGQNYYTASGTYTTVLTNSKGCDSTITLQLTVGNTYDTLKVTACDQYAFNGNTYTSSNTYTINMGSNSQGCDSIVVMELLIHPSPEAGIDLRGTTIIAIAPDAAYQWLDCADNHKPIAGQTSQSFAPETDGSYAVEISKQGCTVTSDCIDLSGVYIHTPSVAQSVQVFPNPATTQLQIKSSYTMAITQIRVWNCLGQTMNASVNTHATQYLLDIAPWADGIYYLEVTFADNSKLKQQFAKK